MKVSTKKKIHYLSAKQVTKVKLHWIKGGETVLGAKEETELE